MGGNDTQWRTWNSQTLTWKEETRTEGINSIYIPESKCQVTEKIFEPFDSSSPV